MNNIMYAFVAVGLGVAISFQPPINATMARVLGSPLLATSISIFISLIVVVPLWLTWGKGGGDLSQFKMLPWWVVIGGVIGVIYVAGSIITAPILGVALFFICVVAGQLIGSSIIDQWGAFGLEVKPINTMKLIGIGFVLLGAVLVQNSSS
jgi:bacterial/archaeal transporter family-2 protein